MLNLLSLTKDQLIQIIHHKDKIIEELNRQNLEFETLYLVEQDKTLSLEQELERRKNETS